MLSLNEFQKESRKGCFLWRHNAWYKEEPFEIYLRLDKHSIPRYGVVDCFTLSNIESTKPGSGKFIQVIEKLEKIARERGANFFYLENIHNTGLIPKYEKLGFKIFESECGLGPPQGFKILR